MRPDLVASWAVRPADPAAEPIDLEAIDDAGKPIGRGWGREEGPLGAGVYRVDITVDPAHRRTGAGSLLLLQLMTEAARRGATAVRMRVDAAAEPGVAFARHHGFAELHRMINSILPVDRADISRAPFALEQVRNQGITVSTLAHDLLSDDVCLDRLHDLVAAVVADIPTGDPPVPLTFEEFRRGHVDDPGIIADAYFLARLGERYVGLSYLHEIDRPGAVQQALSGVRREYRNRGIARALKLKAIEWAAVNGYTAVLATNHSTNPTMLELNRSLGFEPEHAEIRFERRL